MKVIVRIYKWILLSIILQLLFLLFLNNYYLIRRFEVTETSYEISEKPKSDIGLKVPEEASQIKVSFDGSYVSYFINDKIEVTEIKSKKQRDTISNSSGKITYYEWLPDRNMIIYGVKVQKEETGQIQIFTKDMDSLSDHGYPKIVGLPKESEVTGIELSPLTNVVYSKVKVSSTKERIYKFNIMDHSNYIMNINTDSIIKQARYTDKLIYEDSQRRIRVRDGNSGDTSSLPFKGKIALLGIDEEDRAYIGELDDGSKVSKILYGKLKEDEYKSWEQLTLNSAILPKDIIITSIGAIYTISENDNVIRNLKNNNEISFNGKFLEILDNYIVTLDDNKLKLSVIKEN